MSDDDSDQDCNIKSEKPQNLSANILKNTNPIKANEQFVLKLTKEDQNVDKKARNCCKILCFSSEWNLKDILDTIDGLSPKEYPQLFCFIIDSADSKFSAENQENLSEIVKNLQEKLLKFSKSRPIILQLTFEGKIYYKLETSSEFNIIDQQQSNFNIINDFPSFLCSFLNNKVENFEDDMVKVVNEVSDLTIILRFLRILTSNDKFFERLVLEVTKNGSENDFKAVLDAPFDDSDIWLSNNMKYLTDIISIDAQSEICSSVLHTAINNKNTNLTNYLIFDLTYIIQELPFNHQVDITTAAFDTNQLDVLCDLVDIADFPFPSNFCSKSINHERLFAIVTERGLFEIAIKFENFNRIVQYLEENSYLKIVFNISNTSALKVAEESKRYKIFNDLKLRGFHTTNPSEDIREFEMEVDEFVRKQRKKNIDSGLMDDQMAVNLLCNRSLIHNKNIIKEQESEYRKKIRSWYEAINKVKNGAEFLKVAASCPKLKIMFDFDNNTVENTSLESPGSSGVMYSASKWIFIGAKLIDKIGNSREQKIKGVVAHELCHYVMKLVYQNNENPYFKHKKDIKKIFRRIAKKIKEWIAEQSDDQCSGIISSVFTCYNQKDFHPELIVRVIQILLEFDDSPEKLKELEVKYEILFKFWIAHVVPDMQNYLNRNEDVVKLNGFLQLLSVVSDLKCELKSGQEINNLERNNIVIVQSNIPMLVLISIHKYLQEKFGNLLDSQNIFVKTENLLNQQICEYFKEVCAENHDLRIIIDCREGFANYLETDLINKGQKFIFVVSNEQQCEEVKGFCDKYDLRNLTKLELNYEWKELTEESQNLLLETQISFQNNPKIKLKDIIGSDLSFSEIIDAQLLNLILDQHQVVINKTENPEKCFELLFIKRYLHAKTNNIVFPLQIERSYGVHIFSHTENRQYVLISDYAGNGKSWAIKKLAQLLREKNPTSSTLRSLRDKIVNLNFQLSWLKIY